MRALAHYHENCGASGERWRAAAVVSLLGLVAWFAELAPDTGSEASLRKAGQILVQIPFRVGSVTDLQLTSGTPVQHTLHQRRCQRLRRQCVEVRQGSSAVTIRAKLGSYQPQLSAAPDASEWQLLQDGQRFAAPSEREQGVYAGQSCIERERALGEQCARLVQHGKRALGVVLAPKLDQRSLEH
jgi:hypothetical protein